VEADPEVLAERCIDRSKVSPIRDCTPEILVRHTRGVYPVALDDADPGSLPVSRQHTHDFVAFLRCDLTTRPVRRQGGWFRLPDGAPDPLWEALRERCGAYLQENQIDPRLGWPCFLYCVGAMTLVQPMLYYWGFLSPNVGVACASAVGMALAAWAAFRLAHDGTPLNPHLRLLCALMMLMWGDRPGEHMAVFRNLQRRSVLVRWWAFLLRDMALFGMVNPVVWELDHALHHRDTNGVEDSDLFHYIIFLRLFDKNISCCWQRVQVYRCV
jgi:hypothetical protein